MRGWRSWLFLTLLMVALGSLLFASGSIQGNPHYAHEKDLLRLYDASIGEQVEVGGPVIGLNPLRIKAEYGPRELELVILNANPRPEIGQHLRVFGRVLKDDTISADTYVVREDWELWYVYGISLVGGIWVLSRFINGWRFRTSDLEIIPRETSLVSSWKGGGNGLSGDKPEDQSGEPDD